MTQSRRLFLLPLALMTTLYAACGGGDSGTNPGNAAPVLTKLLPAGGANGDAQTHPVADTLPIPLRVFLSVNGLPQAGTTVNWSTSGTGAAVTPPTSVTGSDGTASTRWVLGQISGSQSAQAAVTGATGSPVTFLASGTPGRAALIFRTEGDNQQQAINTTLADPLLVRVADSFGNGVANVGVAWQVTQGSATLSSMSSITNSSGLASTIVTLGGTAGVVTIQASSGSLTGSPIVFTATAFTTLSVTVGNDFYQSNKNQSTLPSVDTVAVGTVVTWTWVNTGTETHNITSIGVPSFTSSPDLTGSGMSYSFTFTTVGLYSYTCSIHGTPQDGSIRVQ